MTILYNLFGIIMATIYRLVGNFGTSIVLFTLAVKLITLPFGYMQQKSMMIMSKMKPEQDRITKKYADDKEKANIEIMALYKRYNYSMVSACLPTLLQLPIMVALFMVLREPQTYVFADAAAWAAIPKTFLWIADIGVSPKDLYALYGWTSTPFLLSLVFPALSLGFSLLNMKLTASGNAAQNNLGMNIMMNGLVLYMAFVYTQGLVIYWTCNSLFGIIQYLLLKKMIASKIPEPLPETKEKKKKKKKSTSGTSATKTPRPSSAIDKVSDKVSLKKE